ncbi:hypothetical protein FGO68_gene15482 [Halteria grandinella]|uniref:Uncharacterized protein n=1 Tax=Halteria grandinella TaxID=5974 RepID=A0A8J8NLC9_HALGN|nr:hypothetical protein FGO68_gene15482 [Halteria grandinella]
MLHKQTNQEQSQHSQMSKERVYCTLRNNAKVGEIKNVLTRSKMLQIIKESSTNSLPNVNDDGDLIATYSVSENRVAKYVDEDQEYFGLQQLAWNCIRLKPNCEEVQLQKFPSREIPHWINSHDLSSSEEGFELELNDYGQSRQMALGLAIESCDGRENDNNSQIIDSDANQDDSQFVFQDLSPALNSLSLHPIKLNKIDLCKFNGTSNIKHSRKIIIINKAALIDECESSQPNNINDIIGSESKFQQDLLENSNNLKFSFPLATDQDEYEEMEEIPEENANVRPLVL